MTPEEIKDIAKAIAEARLEERRQIIADRRKLFNEHRLFFTFIMLLPLLAGILVPLLLLLYE